MKVLKTWVAAAALLAMTGTAQAALIDQGDGTVLDDITNLIWLQDWSNGVTSYGNHMDLAGGLSFAGSTDWRLPSIDEYSALFTEYGNLSLVSQFTNVQSGRYWSGTLANLNDAWYFNPDTGNRNIEDQREYYFAVAVRPGDVTAAVPEPGTLALLGISLAGLGFARRRRAA